MVVTTCGWGVSVSVCVVPVVCLWCACDEPVDKPVVRPPRQKRNGSFFSFFFFFFFLVLGNTLVKSSGRRLQGVRKRYCLTGLLSSQGRRGRYGEGWDAAVGGRKRRASLASETGAALDNLRRRPGARPLIEGELAGRAAWVVSETRSQ